VKGRATDSATATDLEKDSVRVRATATDLEKEKDSERDLEKGLVTGRVMAAFRTGAEVVTEGCR